MGQGTGSWPALGPWSPHSGTGANTVRHCSVTPHTQVGSREWVGQRASQALPFCLRSPSRTQGRRVGEGGRNWLKIPRAAQNYKGWSHLGPQASLLGLGNATSCLRAECYVSLIQIGSWHLVAGHVPARAAQEWGQGPGLGQCQWATGDSNFCRRRRRSSAASGSPSSGGSSVPTDSGAGGCSGAGGEAPGDGVVA